MTAIRALFRSAYINKDSQEAIAETRACWANAPICTSVVVTFWQRYLCHWSDKLKLENEINVDAMKLIRRWMPLKADRTLPGDLLAALLRRMDENLSLFVYF